jgi:hypothetical protein
MQPIEVQEYKKKIEEAIRIHILKLGSVEGLFALKTLIIVNTMKR